MMTSGAVALALSTFGGAAVAQDASVDFSVSGTSTIRGWTCTVPGTVELTEGSGTAVPGLEDGVQVATLTVRVADFECPEEEMREHLLEAMRSDEYPEITFRLDGYEASGGTAMTTGSLTILDTTQTVRFPLSVSSSGSGVEVSGEVPLDMTTYGVKPPAVMLGLLVVRPNIRIEFSGTINR